MNDHHPPLLLTDGPITEPTTLDLPADVPVVEIRHDGVGIDDLPRLFDAGYGVLAGLGPIGPGYAIYDGDPATTFNLRIGFPVVEAPAELPDAVMAATFPSGRALAVTHGGPYDGLAVSWARLTDLPGIGTTGRWIEIYVTDPSVTPAEESRTDLVIPLD